MVIHCRFFFLWLSSYIVLLMLTKLDSQSPSTFSRFHSFLVFISLTDRVLNTPPPPPRSLLSRSPDPFSLHCTNRTIALVKLRRFSEDIALPSRKIFQQTFVRWGQKFAAHHTNVYKISRICRAIDPLDALLLKLAYLLISCRCFQHSPQISPNWSLSKL